MNNQYHLICIFVGLLLLILLLYSSYSTSESNKNRLCNQPYALCTSARCIPDPENHNKAICFCDVESGPSMSTVPCKQLAPTTDKNGIQTVYSTFSLKQAREGMQPMTCPSASPWTWCLNKKCTVNPSNPSQAICSCDIKRNQGEWTTFGGNGNTSTCENAYWSGALLSDLSSGTKFLNSHLNDLAYKPTRWNEKMSNNNR